MAKQGAVAGTPKLRFPRFAESGEWTLEKLKDVANLVSDKVPISTLRLDTYVSTENLLPDYGEMISAAKLPDVASVTRFDRDDILISNIRPYLRKVWRSDRSGGSSNDIVVVRAKEPVSEAFLSAVLRNDTFIAYVMSGAKGVKMPRGDIDAIREYPFAYPAPAEQQKIADCLTSLDDVIAAQRRKVEALKAHKRGLMQQLFPREDKTRPRLRFPEFGDAPEWREAALGPLTSKVGSGVTPRGGDANYKANGRPFVRSQNVGWGLLLLDDIAFIDESTHASFLGTEVMKSDVLLNITGASIGRSAVADERIASGNVNQHVCIIRAKREELNPVLLNQFLISERGQEQIDSFQAGGNRQGLNFAQIRSFQIPLPPTIDEQQRIADCLSSLDTRITAESNQLAALKTHKQGLMQQLFPAPDAATA